MFQSEECYLLACHIGYLDKELYFEIQYALKHNTELRGSSLAYPTHSACGGVVRYACFHYNEPRTEKKGKRMGERRATSHISTRRSVLRDDRKISRKLWKLH